MKLFFITLIGTSALLAFIGCGERKASTKKAVIKQDTISVGVLTVTPGKFTEYGIYYGKIAPANEARLICYTGGRVEALHAQEGDIVARGFSLAAIDSASASSLLETAQLQESIALKNLEQTKKHLAEGNASPLAVDQSHLAFLSAQNNRINTEKNYRGALAITPISGLVTFRSVDLYQELPPGTPTFTVSQTSTMKVSVSVLESDIIHCKKGGKAEITIAQQPDQVWDGTMHSIAQQASTIDNTFRIELSIANPKGMLTAGITGKVKLLLKTHNNALVIPTDIISTNGVQQTIMLVRPDGIVEQRTIKAGPQSDTQTMVVGGLTPGERVIVSGQQLVADGFPVKITGP